MRTVAFPKESLGSISEQTALEILTSANGSDEEVHSAEELKRIAENALLPLSQENSILHSLANHRYNIICSTPGKVCVSIVNINLRIVSLITHLLGLKNLTFNIWSLTSYFAHYAKSDFIPNQPLIRAMNRLQHKDISFLHSIHFDNSAFTMLEEINTGVCRGASLWFNSLYLNNISKFADPEELLKRTASLFATGAPREALILHKVDAKYFPQEGLIAPHPSSQLILIPKDNNEMLKKREILYENIEDIRKLSPNIYLLEMKYLGSEHIMSFIKISDDCAYIFDPSYGLFKFEGDDIPSQINNYLNYYNKLKNFTLNYERIKKKIIEKKYPHLQMTPKHFIEFYVRIIPTTLSIKDTFDHLPTILHESDLLNFQSKWDPDQYDLIRDEREILLSIRILKNKKTGKLHLYPDKESIAP